MYPTDDRAIRLSLLVRELRARTARVRELNATLVERVELAKKALAPLLGPE